MKKRLIFITVTFVVLSCILSGCQKNPVIETASDFYQSVTVPYKAVLTPVLYNDKIFMSVSTENRTETDCCYLIEYDINTQESNVIFESTHTLANIQQIQHNNKWLIWNDLELYGTASNLYAMNLESREIQTIYNFSSDGYTFIIPVVMDDSVYWMESSTTDSTGVIKSYNCITKEINVVQKVHSASFENVKISANNGKVAWCDIIDNSYYIVIYDALTGNTEKILVGKTSISSPRYYDGYLTYLEGFTLSSSKVNLYTLNDKRTRELDMFHYKATIMDEYAVSSSGEYTWFYRFNNNQMTPIRCLTDKADFTVSPNNIVITQKENEGYLSNTELVNETELHIYRLNDLPKYRILE